MRKNLNIIDFLTQVPWWLSVSLSASFYILLKYVVPHFETQANLINGVHVSFGPTFAPVIALALLSPVTFSLFKSNRRKKLQELREEIREIQELSWPEFKKLVADAYTRSGYTHMENSAFTSDPSVDLVMRKGANLYLVQCRYWQNRKLGKREVKNLMGLMRARQASGAFLLTTGIFTNEARHYAAGIPVSLVDGAELVELLGKVQRKPATELLN